MRELVTIRTISDIQPIEGADAIELAIVDGWQCVSKKGEFAVGDKAVYFEIDSYLPVTDERFEFLRKSSFKRMGELEGFRLKTIRLRGQISQGLIVPLDKFPELVGKEDEDLSEILGVLKYEPPVPTELSGQVKGNLPFGIPTTDQERIQNIWGKLNYNLKGQDVEFECTLKLDGTSMTAYHCDGATGCTGRNWEYTDTDTHTFFVVARRQKLFEAMTALKRNIALRGECIGEGIQGNPEKLKGHDFFIFDIFDIDEKRYLYPQERMDVINDLIALGAEPKHTVVYEDIKPFETFETVNDILKFAEGPSINAKIREGVVFKSKYPVNGQFISFKAISNMFLLKCEE